MRKPLFLAFVGVSIVVSGASLGTILTRYLSLRAYSPRVSAVAATPDESGTPPPAEEWKNPFSPSQGMQVPSRLPAAAGKGGAPVSRTSFILVGTIFSTTPSARRAILWAEGMKEPKAYRETEEVEPGAVLASVERDKAWLARGSEREKLDLLPVGSRARGPAAPPGAPRSAATQVVSVPAPPSPGGPSTATGSAGNADGEGQRRGIGYPVPAQPPPVVGAAPGAEPAGEEVDEAPPRRRRPAGGRRGR